MSKLRPWKVLCLLIKTQGAQTWSYDWNPVSFWLQLLQQ